MGKGKENLAWTVVAILIIFLTVFCLLVLYSLKTETYSYQFSYNREAKETIKKAANAHEFGDVFNPGFELQEDYILQFEKVVGMPSRCRTQYLVVYVNPGISMENVLSKHISYEYALIQENEATKNLNISRFVKLANSGSQDLLYGGY